MQVRVQEGSSQWHACPIGGMVLRASIKRLDIPEHHTVRVFDGANPGARRSTAVFHAGKYVDTWLYGKWLHNNHSPKYIQVGTTELAERELLVCTWREKNRAGNWCSGFSKFGPGAYEYLDGDFDRNDVFERVYLPQDATVTLWDNARKTGDWVEYKNEGTHDLRRNDLAHRISSLEYKRDEWVEKSQRLGDMISRREIGIPISIPFKARGPAGIVVHPYVNLGASTEDETTWHLDQRVGVSATIGTGEASPVKAEFTVSAETEAGGGGRSNKQYTQETGITVDVATDSTGRADGFIHGQLLEGERQVFRDLENARTKEIITNAGEITGRFYEYEVDVEHGTGVL